MFPLGYNITTTFPKCKRRVHTTSHNPGNAQVPRQAGEVHGRGLEHDGVRREEGAEGAAPDHIQHSLRQPPTAESQICKVSESKVRCREEIQNLY